MADSGRTEELRRRLDREPGSRLFAQLAEELRKAGEHSEAIAVARAGLVQHPGYTSARLTLARALFESQQHAGARGELETVLRGAPDNILASRLLGDCLTALGDLGSALLQLRATRRLAPEDQSLDAQVVALEERLHGTPSARGFAKEGASTEPTPAFGDLDLGAAVSSTGAGEVPTAPEPGRTGIRVIEPEVHEAGGTDLEGPRVGFAEWVSVGPATGAVLGPVPASQSVSGWQGERPTEASGAGQGGGPAGAARLEEVEGSNPRRSEDSIPMGAIAEPQEDSNAPSGVVSMSSATLAELYFQQGSPEKAAEVYRELLAREPRNEKTRARLTEIEAQLGSRGGDSAAVGSPEWRARRVRVVEAIDRLERFLETLKSAKEGAR